MAYARGDGVLFFNFGTDFDHAHFGRCLVFGGVVMWKGRSGITLVSEPRCVWRKVEIPMVNPTQAILPVYIDRRRETVARVGRTEQTWAKREALPLCRRKRWQLSLALAGWNHSPRHQVTSLARACLPTPLQVSRLRVDRRRIPTCTERAVIRCRCSVTALTVLHASPQSPRQQTSCSALTSWELRKDTLYRHRNHHNPVMLRAFFSLQVPVSAAPPPEP